MINLLWNWWGHPVQTFSNILTYSQWGLYLFIYDLLHSQTQSFRRKKGSLMAPLLQGLLDSRILSLALLKWLFPACLTETTRWNIVTGLLWKDRGYCAIKYCALVNITSGSMLSCNYLPSSTVESSWVTLTARRSILSWREFALM